MTDQERARALAEALLGPVGLTGAVLAALEQSFAAVRRDEQRAIAAYLRRRAEQTSLAYVPVHWLANEVELGEHERGEVVP